MRYVFRFFLAGILALLLLSGFVYLYGYAGIHIANPERSTDYVWRPESFKSTMSEGFTWFRMDKNGFNNAVVPERVDVLFYAQEHRTAHGFSNTAVVAGHLN